MRQTLNASGAVTASASYNPWGVPIAGMIAPFGFTGELQDSAGQVYLRARWYAAGAGRFTTRDTFLGWENYPDTLHPYLYSGNNPVLYRDPMGNTWYLSRDEAEDLHLELQKLSQYGTSGTLVGFMATIWTAFQAVAPKLIDSAALGSRAATEVTVTIPTIMSIPIAGFGFWAACESYQQTRLNELSILIGTANQARTPKDANASADGIALAFVPGWDTVVGGGTMYALNRSSGALFALKLEWFFTRGLQQSLRPELVAFNTNDVNQGFHFSTETPLSVLPPMPTTSITTSVRQPALF